MENTEAWRDTAVFRLKMTERQKRVMRTSLQMFLAPRDRQWDVLCREIAEAYGGPARVGGDDVIKAASRLFQEAGEIACRDGYQRPDSCGMAESVLAALAETNKGNAEKATNLRLPYASVVIMQNALEEYCRIRYGQWFDLANAISDNGYRFDNASPDHTAMFNRYIARRNEAHDILCTAGRLIIPRLASKPKNCIIAEDIFRVLRHFLFVRNHPGGSAIYDIRAATPLLISGEPTIEIAVLPSLA